MHTAADSVLTLKPWKRRRTEEADTDPDGTTIPHGPAKDEWIRFQALLANGLLWDNNEKDGDPLKFWHVSVALSIFVRFKKCSFLISSRTLDIFSRYCITSLLTSILALRPALQWRDFFLWRRGSYRMTEIV